MNLELTFNLHGNKYSADITHNLMETAANLDDLFSTITEDIPIYWYSHRDKKYYHVSAWVNIQGQKDEIEEEEAKFMEERSHWR